MKKNKTLRRIISITAVLAVLAGAMFGARAMIDRRRTIPVVAVSMYEYRRIHMNSN